MFNKIYTNGCSFTCAGGLDDLNVRKKYKEILNIELSENYIQYAYSNIIGKKLQLSVHNDAVSGGSVNGLIRKTYEYVYKNQSKISETLFILELPPMWRDEVYSNELGVIMNVNVSTVENPQSGIPAAIEHPVGDIKNLSKNLQSYFYNFINTEFEYKKSMNNLLGLLCFLKNNDVNVVLIDNCFFEKFLKNNKLNYNFNFIDFNGEAMYVWFQENKLTINSELNIDIDGHAGYYGNQKIAEIVLNYLYDNKFLEK
jgi:hypothetical protein